MDKFFDNVLQSSGTCGLPVISLLFGKTLVKTQRSDGGTLWLSALEMRLCTLIKAT